MRGPDGAQSGIPGRMFELYDATSCGTTCARWNVAAVAPAGSTACIPWFVQAPAAVATARPLSERTPDATVPLAWRTGAYKTGIVYTADAVAAGLADAIKGARSWHAAWPPAPAGG